MDASAQLICDLSAWNWNAIGAIATALATLVALGFGVREAIVHWLDRKRRRTLMAAAVLHAVGETRIQASQAALQLAPALVAGHRGRLKELGAALTFPSVEPLLRYTGDAEIFGKKFAGYYGYATGLAESFLNYAKWLQGLTGLNEAQWEVVVRSMDFQKAALEQLADSLIQVETVLKEHATEDVMVLRFGKDWREVFEQTQQIGRINPP